VLKKSFYFFIEHEVFFFLMAFSGFFLAGPFKCISISMIASKATMIYAMEGITGNDL
jgi:hypothetical protein